jgi:hypothetical protein
MANHNKTCYAPLNEWITTVASNLPNLSQPQATVLAIFSFGMVLAKCCALTAVVIIVAPLMKVAENTLRQRLREWYYDAENKRGEKRLDLNVESCFSFLLRWLLSLWHGKQLALALDATTLSDHFVVLALSVVYRGCAIPIAWKVLHGNREHPWRQEWLRLLQKVKTNIPSDMIVIVLTDRGLYASWLFRRIRRLGWHPFMRINSGGTFKEARCGYYRPLTSYASQPNTRFSSQGVAFKTKGKQLPSTLLACFQQDMEEAWFILTDLPPSCCDVCWYGFRAWIEQGFRTIKRGGWQWHRTRITDPMRAQRIWLVISVATFWLVSVGTEVDEKITESTSFMDVLFEPHKQSQLPSVSVFRRGWVRILVALLHQENLPHGIFIPEPSTFTDKQNQFSIPNHFT